MEWARIMAPLSGGEGDKRLLAVGAGLAEAFGAELACVHCPADLANMIPWMGDGFMGGVQATAVESIRSAAAEGSRAAKAAVEANPYKSKSFLSLSSPVWAALAVESRLSDVVLFDQAASCGKGPLAEAFQQIVADEQRPTLIVKGPVAVGGIIAVAWDGGKEASRALRTALPLLQRATKVFVMSAVAGSGSRIDPARAVDFLSARDVRAEAQVLTEAGDPAAGLLKAAAALGADILVAGAFGHPRLQEFIFGGATRTFLNAGGPSLFLSH